MAAIRHREPSWVSDVMWWHVYPLGFVGAPIRGALDEPQEIQHRLTRMHAWLDHVVSLGLNGLQLGPVFASSTHGYDTVDYFRVDPRLGDEADLVALIDAAHAKGLRVLLDGVFNHVGRAHPLFREVEEQGPASPTARMFRIDWDGWEPGAAVKADVFEGHDHLVALQHNADEVADLVVEVMAYWLDRGIDGWRLDAAYAVPPAFWARVLPRVRERHPQAWFTGEVIHGDAAGIVTESRLDSLTQYELWQGIWHAIADRNMFELAHAMERHGALLDTFVPSTFVGNHDVTRIASAVGDDFVAHALAVLMSVAGTPGIYAGDEYGWRGVKEERAGGDDAIRPTFPDAPPAPDSLEPRESGVLRLTHSLVALRRDHPWLHPARTETIHVANRAIVLRTAVDDHAVVCALNLDDAPVSLPAGGASTVLAGHGDIQEGHVTLDARGWALLE